MKTTIFIIIIFLIYSGAVIGIWYLVKKAYKTYSKFDNIEKQVKNAVTKLELEVIWKEFVEIVNRECWHKHLTARAREIKIMIETKYSLL